MNNNNNTELKEVSLKRMNLKSLVFTTSDGKEFKYQSGEGRELSQEVKEEICRGILYVLRRYGFDLHRKEETLDLHVRLKDLDCQDYNMYIWADNAAQINKFSWKGGLKLERKDGVFHLVEYNPANNSEEEELDSISQYNWDYGWQRREDDDIRDMIFLQRKLFTIGGFKALVKYVERDLSEDEFREFTIFEGEATRDSYPWRMRTRFTPYFKGNYEDGKRNLASMNTAKRVFENKKGEFPDTPEFVQKAFKGLSGYKNTEINFKTNAEVLEWIWNHPKKRVFYSSLINDSQIKRETSYLSSGKYKSRYYAFMYDYWKEREEGNWYQGTFEDIYPDFSLSNFKSLVRRAGEYVSIEIKEEGKRRLTFDVGRYPDDSTGYIKLILSSETLEEELENIPNLPWNIPQGKEERYKNNPDDLWSMQVGFKRDWAESWNKFWFDLVGLEGYRKLEKQGLTIIE